jgi:RNA polymerase sigma-70 factor (ECF subfamily)
MSQSAAIAQGPSEQRREEMNPNCCATLPEPILLEPVEMSEAEAIRRAQAGDGEAFERIYRLHSRRVYALCLRMMKGNATEAEDLTQEAFVLLFRKIGTFRAESAFSTWLHRLAFNVVLMRMRKNARGDVHLEETNDSDDEATASRREIGARDVRLSGVVDRVNLQRALDQLPSGYRSVFVLHDVFGYEHNEIASIWGCTVGNSKSQLHKARLRLRQLLLQGKQTHGRARHKRSEDRSQPIYALSFGN